MLDSVRKDFTVLNQKVYGKPLVYLDSAATAQKPKIVIEKIVDYYENFYASVNRGAHFLSEKVTAEYDNARKIVANFINAPSDNNIIFTSGTTHSINLVASGLGKSYFKTGDEIILTTMEHHANIVPWFMLAKQIGLTLKIAKILPYGELDFEDYKSLFSHKTKLAAFCHASNVLGTINPISEMIKFAKSFTVPTLIDAAQSAPHLPIDVSLLDCDFLAFSGHKVYGPTGIGVLYMKPKWQEILPPFIGGGAMINSVSFEDITFATGAQKFEAGTPNIAGAIGLAKALEYIKNISHEKIYQHESELHDYAYKKMSTINRVKILGPKDNKVSLISFIVEGIHPHDVASIIDREGIAIRTGFLCAEPLVKSLGTPSVCRISFAVYNNFEDIDRFLAALNKALEIFKI